MLALSIVGPHASNIAAGKKTLEVRSWRPESLPIRDLLIVENSRFLSSGNPIDLNGRAVAIVDVEEVHKWQPFEVEAACSNSWKPGYWAWNLSNVRPVTNNVTVPARRKLYEVELTHVVALGICLCDTIPAQGKVKGKA
ncbi:ASCH domain-containing protein [Alloalcanivorax xenomutans]|uniref:ASCH domain-containing protein n=1 Tax=Alloalcanivorax xenomutans TaxID=1094342 RepID=UPI003BAA5B4F